MRTVLLVLMLAFATSVTPSVAHAADWDAWQQAKADYDAGRYEDALHEFTSHPTESAQYFHDIGTVYLKMGQPGPAVSYLSKANHLRAHDPEIQHNLVMARSALGRLIGNEHLDPASSSVESLADRLSMGEVRGALGLLGLIVAALWLRAYVKTRSLTKTLLQPSGMIGLMGFAVTLGLYGTERLAEARPPAFAVARITVRSGPGDQFAQLGQLEAGTKIRMLGPSETVQSGDQKLPWDQVQYSQDGVGWVPASSLLLF